MHEWSILSYPSPSMRMKVEFEKEHESILVSSINLEIIIKHIDS